VSLLEIIIKIDSRGRLKIPAEIQEKFHLTPDSEVVLIAGEGEIRIRKREVKYSFQEIFGKPLKFDRSKVLAMDVANLEEDFSDL